MFGKVDTTKTYQGTLWVRLTERTNNPLAQASFIEEDTLAWQPQKPRISFDFSFIFKDFSFDFCFFTNQAQLPYFWLIFEASVGFLQPARVADFKSPVYDNSPTWLDFHDDIERLRFSYWVILFKSSIANMVGFLLWLSITSIIIEVFKVVLEQWLLFYQWIWFILQWKE